MEQFKYPRLAVEVFSLGVNAKGKNYQRRLGAG